LIIQGSNPGKDRTGQVSLHWATGFINQGSNPGKGKRGISSLGYRLDNPRLESWQGQERYLFTGLQA